MGPEDFAPKPHQGAKGQLLGVVKPGNRTTGVRNTGNAVAGIAQVGISHMGEFGGPPGIRFGAKPKIPQIPLELFSVLNLKLLESCRNHFWC